ncbi:hypothetical protein Tco_1072060, partial [Tanacetum coccineum]
MNFKNDHILCFLVVSYRNPSPIQANDPSFDKKTTSKNKRGRDDETQMWATSILWKADMYLGWAIQMAIATMKVKGKAKKRLLNDLEDPQLPQVYLSDNPWFHHIRFIEFEPSSDEDDQDAQHQAIQDDNPTITELIHVEYSLDDISKTETPIVIEEDETLMVEATTKLHKVQTEDNSIMPEEATSKDSPLKEIQHQIVPVSRDKSDNVMSLSRHCTSHYYPMVQVEIKGLSKLSFKTGSQVIRNEVSLVRILKKWTKSKQKRTKPDTRKKEREKPRQ